MKFVHPPLPMLQPDKHYLVVQFPHAVYPMACWLAYSFVGTKGSGLVLLSSACAFGSLLAHASRSCAGVPGDLSAGIADVFFKLPIIKHNYAWAGSVSAGLADLSRLQGLDCRAASLTLAAVQPSLCCCGY